MLFPRCREDSVTAGEARAQRCVLRSCHSCAVECTWARVARAPAACRAPCLGPQGSTEFSKSLTTQCHGSLPQTGVLRLLNRASAFLSSGSRPSSTLTPMWIFPQKLSIL